MASEAHVARGYEPWDSYTKAHLHASCCSACTNPQLKALHRTKYSIFVLTGLRAVKLTVAISSYNSQYPTPNERKSADQFEFYVGANARDVEKRPMRVSAIASHYAEFSARPGERG